MKHKHTLIPLLLALLALLTACAKPAEAGHIPAPAPVEAAEPPAGAQPVSPAQEESSAAEAPAGKTVLTLAGVDFDFAGLTPIINEFNASSTDYTVSLLDYGHGLDNLQQGQMRMNTAILAGSCPDLIFLGGAWDAMSPLTYIAQGILLDLDPYLDADPDIAQEDILIYGALHEYGGLYLLSPTFYTNTLCCSPETYEAHKGWDIAEFLAVEAGLGPDQYIVATMSPERFLEVFAARYLHKALDFETGTCALDTPEFIALLNSATQVKENTFEFDPDEQLPHKVLRGEYVCSASMISSVEDIGMDNYRANNCEKGDARLAYIGWPTEDGSSGSDIDLTLPIGVCSQTENADGCWEFLKYLLLHPILSNNFSTGFYRTGAPTYAPLLEKQVEAANKSGFTWTTTQQDMDDFIALASGSTHLAYYDQDALRIILEEAAALFSGAATAEDVAQRIQSRVSLYMMEQYG